MAGTSRQLLLELLLTWIGVALYMKTTTLGNILLLRWQSRPVKHRGNNIVLEVLHSHLKVFIIVMMER